MTPIGTLALAHRAAVDRVWGDVYQLLNQIDAESSLAADDLALLATAAYMVGREDDMVAALERAHQLHLEAGDILAAARAGFWIGLDLALRGEMGPASGWLGRTQRLVEQHGAECAEAGYLMVPGVIQMIGSGEAAAAANLAGDAIRIGQRFGEVDLVALAVHAQGRALMSEGRVPEGLRLLDEAMVAVMADHLSPIVTGIIYCSVIEGCHEVKAIRRAREWTEALSDWCGQQPGLVAFTGQCLTHRAELMQLRGDWQGAMAEAAMASTRFQPGMNELPAAQAHYRMGELHRLRGEFESAERAYRDASAWGWSPQPGLGLLRLAQGRFESALTSLATAHRQATHVAERANVLPALIDAHLAAGNVEEATEASRELAEIAVTHDSTMLTALSDEGLGRVQLARDEAGEAVAALTRARSGWQELVAPYEAARVRAALATAYRRLGDDESAALESQAARTTFVELGALPDLARLEPADVGPLAAAAGGLTRREVEVLRMLAEGKTNREIGDELFVSHRTIDRHVSNILTKLGLSSRTAAAAHALQHGLI